MGNESLLFNHSRTDHAVVALIHDSAVADSSSSSDDDSDNELNSLERMTIAAAKAAPITK